MNGNIKNSNKVGYTLIELIIVLALMGIVLSVAIPSIKIIYNISERKELMEFRRDIVFARNKAVMENGVYTLRINILENKYWIIKEHDSMSIVKEKEFQSGITLKLDNLDRSITFYSTGTPNKAGTIKLTNKKNQNIEISITPATGKVNLKIDGK